MKNFGKRRLLLAAMAGVTYVLLLGGCQVDLLGAGDGSGPDTTIEETGTAQGFVQSEVADLFSMSDFSFEIIDFSDAVVHDQEILSKKVVFSVDAGQGFSLHDTSLCTAEDGPYSCTTLGSLPYVQLRQNGTVAFDSPRRLLGMHVSLSKEQVDKLKGLKPEEGSDSIFRLPQFRVIISGYNAAGERIDSIRSIPASATYKDTIVAQDWVWIDTSLLGEIAGFSIEIESPIGDISYILVDNITTSTDFVPDDTFFTIALIPDTQKYVETAAYQEIFSSQTEYLVSKKNTERIVFVSHLGDIVENGEIEMEWMAADTAMSVLDGVVPYGIVVGNHDFVDEWHPEKGSPYFLSHFPSARFETYPWWIGTSPDGLSSCQSFDTPLGKFLYFHLSVDSPPPTVEWAQGIIDANPGIPTLVTTHAYLRENGRIPVPYLASVGSIAWKGISADELFETLIAPNSQIFMVTCGHISAEHHQISINESGLEVYELLQDYQNRENGGEGFLRLMRFFPGQNAIQIVTYSPWLQMYEIDTDSYFSLAVDFDARL